MKKIDLLKSVSLFWDLDELELGYISDKMVSKSFDNGNLIFLEESEGEKKDEEEACGFNPDLSFTVSSRKI